MGLQRYHSLFLYYFYKGGSKITSGIKTLPCEVTAICDTHSNFVFSSTTVLDENLLSNMDYKLDKIGYLLLNQYIEMKSQNLSLMTEIKELQNLYSTKTLQLSSQLEILVLENKRLQQLREAKKIKLMARKASRKQRTQIRAPILAKDYDLIIAGVKERKPLNAALFRLALTVLLLTGIRVGNLKMITLNDLTQLFSGDDFIIESIKCKDRKALCFPANKSYRIYLEKRKEDYQTILSSINENELVWKFSREHLTRKINKILKQAGILLNKNIKSHSFRIGMATAVAENFTIYEAQAILGHARISTTERYIQSKLTKKEKVNIINTILQTTKTGQT